jgi:enoyl-CoA hydratase/carnithine racemase
LGLGFAHEHVVKLVAAVGPAWASELLFTGRRCSADEALRIGLVNHVVDPADLESRTVELAAAIAANAPLTVQAGKAAIGHAVGHPGSADHTEVDAMVRRCFESADYREGQQAFLQKRPPRFEGR